MKWQVIDSGAQSAVDNMSTDSALLETLQQQPRPIVHHYDWIGDCATYGYFTDPFAHLDAGAVSRHALQLARRPTGGGVIFHAFDLAFSVLIPATHPAYSLNTLDNYAFINRSVVEAVQQFLGGQQTPPAQLLPVEPTPLDSSCVHFCMAKPTRYDVMIGQKKVGGAAQRRTKAGFLHQGSIALMLPPSDYMKQLLKPDTQVWAGMLQHTFPLLGEEKCPSALQKARHHLRQLLNQTLVKAY